MNTVRANFGAAVYNNKIYVYGGQSGSGSCDLTDPVEVYDPSSNNGSNGKILVYDFASNSWSSGDDFTSNQKMYTSDSVATSSSTAYYNGSNSGSSNSNKVLLSYKP